MRPRRSGLLRNRRQSGGAWCRCSLAAALAVGAGGLATSVCTASVLAAVVGRAVEPAAAGRRGAPAFLALTERRRRRSFGQPSRPEPHAAERPSVLPPPTRCHASAEHPAGASSRRGALRPPHSRRQSSGASALRRAWLSRWHRAASALRRAGRTPRQLGGWSYAIQSRARGLVVVGGRTHRCRPTFGASVLSSFHRDSRLGV